MKTEVMMNKMLPLLKNGRYKTQNVKTTRENF